VGSTAGTVAAGDDSRLSDSRTPTAHASSHASGGGDAITLAQSQVTNLTTDLAAKANLSGAAFTGNVSTTGTLAATGTISTQAHKIFIQSGTPSSPAAGDVWIWY
jgi:hypothetical protein